MTLLFDVVSIGTLSKNKFWSERAAVRTPHATTTLIRSSSTILVDPSLPPVVLSARLGERTGLRPEQVEVVFLTNFRPVHRRSLEFFDGAEWLMWQQEIDAVREHLETLLGSAHRRGEQDDEIVRDELKILDRIKPAPERITSDVHIFPLPGATAGSCGLLLLNPLRTVVVAGDAVVNRDYLLAGEVHESCADIALAGQSLQELYEIADIIVPGHDNLVFELRGG